MAAVPTSRGWAILDRFVRRRDDGPFPADSPTAASLTNSRGDPFDVCLDLHAPPRPSSLLLRWPGGPTGCEPLEPVAAHGGAVLLLMQYTIPVCRDLFPFPLIDYFVYSAGSTRPSLRRLPPIGGTIEEVQARVEAEGIRTSKPLLRRMECLDTGIIVRSRKEDFAVAELIVDVEDMVARPEVRVFNPAISDQHWELKKPRVVPVRGNDHDLDMEPILWYWETDEVVPWGSYMCWADYSAGGIMLCNVFDEDPDILFLELPARRHRLHRDYGVGKGNMNAYHTLGTTGNGDVLKFAFVLRHDAVVEPTQDDTADPSNFTVTTWTLRVEEGDASMVWVEDSRIAASELWAQDDFALIPRDLLLYPIFSVVDPDEVSFVLEHERRKQEDGSYDAAQIWMVSVDMITKKLKSSFLYVEEKENFSPDEAELFERKNWLLETFLPVEIPGHGSE